MVTASLVARSTATLDSDASKRDQGDAEEARGPWLPADTVFQPGPASADSFLSFYASSVGRRRSFCGRCGTSLAYAAFPMPSGWPDMLDIVLGTIDRHDLDSEALAPERQLWWDYGISWAKSLTAQGIGSLPRHKNYKMNEVADSE
ncbi:MAG: hypothetical protein LQ340_003296 [Diploschistes diacapsis]|nr:MAG: hypothetical protein LQ340_003296 [Diploschistes diacapsis]